MYAICGGDVELYSIEYFRGYGRWLQALSVGRGVVMELYSIEYFRGYGRWLQALRVARGVVIQSLLCGMMSCC